VKQGYVHVYTGEGKGKTTAALGLALRAAGAGLRVFIAQFMKGQKYSELDLLPALRDHITIRQFGLPKFVHTIEQEDLDAAHHGFAEVTQIIAAGAHDLVILDEINVAMHYHLIAVDDVLEVMCTRPRHVELVLTGRGADARIIAAADLVTDMRAVKHYYDNGVMARKGIES